MNNLTIQLSTGDGRCLYQQIYEHIRDEIRKGKLPAGEKLPSTRSLADYLQVARSTVDLAYSQLLAEGYIVSKPCRGYFVSPIEELLDLQEELSVGPVSNQSTEEKVKSEVNDGKILYDFYPHGISMKEFPFATWKKLTRNILVDANTEMFTLGDAQGDWQLRETISRYLHSSRGVNCQPEQIIVGAGSDYLFLLLEKLLGRHVPIAMEDPTYGRALRVFTSFAYEIIPIPMDEQGMSVEFLHRTNARAAYVMPSHQYPTGTVMPIGRRLELLNWACEKEDRYLIEDDYDSEFRYRGKPIPSLQASDRWGRVIYMGTFSKSIAPAIRVGYMVLPQRLLKVYKENCGFYASTVSRIDQRILNEFIRDGYFERYLNKMRKIYREKHDFLLELLKPFEERFFLSGENAGLHVLLTSRKGEKEEELLKKAEQRGIKLYGISKVSLQSSDAAEKSSAGTVLLGYGALDKEQIQNGIGLLREAWEI